MDKNDEMIKIENRYSDITIKLSELMYLLYWGIMLFCKGMGVYDGQNIYKVFLIISFLCIIIKMCITDYNYIEWIIVVLLLSLSTVVYLVSGEKGVLICTVTVIAMKNVSVKRTFRVGLVIWSLAMGVRFLASLLCIENVKTAVQTKNVMGAVLRYFMGYPHPNILHISYLVLVAFAVYCFKERYNIMHLIILALGNLFIFFYSYSYTGAAIVLLYIFSAYFINRHKIGKIEYWCINLFFPFCILFSIFLPLLLRGQAYELADRIFNNRINFAKYFLSMDNISLLGNNLAEITTDIITIDNSFVYVWVIYGIPYFVIMCMVYLMTILRYVTQRKNHELVMICCFLMAGVTEPFLFNTSFKNLTLLFVGEQLFQVLDEKVIRYKSFPIIRNQDKIISISVQKWIQYWKRLQKVWHDHRNDILRLALVLSFIVSVVTGIFYRYRSEVLAVQKENLLIYEKIRIVMTAFCMSFISVIVIEVMIGLIKNKVSSARER